MTERSIQEVFLQQLAARIANLEREYSILLGSFYGLEKGEPLRIACVDTRCQRKGIDGGRIRVPHVYLHGECYSELSGG
jgi:hypothetical protein